MKSFAGEPRSAIESFAVTAAQMQAIEERVFAAGMPVAALMEKVAGAIARRLQQDYPLGKRVVNPQIDRELQPGTRRVGILVGPGHNGGDALVVARELWLIGYEVIVCQPLPRAKELTSQHARYAKSLGIPIGDRPDNLLQCDWIVDGLFGFGLERPIVSPLAEIVDCLNDSGKPIVSIDLPSGLHTDTGDVLGTAIRASQTLCLGLWKRGLLQDRSLEWTGAIDLLDFDLPLADIQAVLGDRPNLQRWTPRCWQLPLPRPLATHKYQQGRLLAVVGSRTYGGAALLAALGARSSGVGMVTLAVPATLQSLIVARVPEALVVPCPETLEGAIANLPDRIDLDRYDAIACGCGLTTAPETLVRQLLASDRPLVLDADGLTLLAQFGSNATLQSRSGLTVLTPHPGEFKRLFPDLVEVLAADRISAARQAAQNAGAIVLLKGARTAIAAPSGRVRVIADSTPALAKGGSGDVLAGLTGGLLATAVAQAAPETLAIDRASALVATAAGWHALAGRAAAARRSELGVDGATLAEFLLSVAADWAGDL